MFPLHASLALCVCASCVWKTKAIQTFEKTHGHCVETAVCDSGRGPPQATTTIHRDSQQHGHFVDHQEKAAGSTPLSPTWLSPPHWVCCVHSHCKLCVMLTACDVAATARPSRRGSTLSDSSKSLTGKTEESLGPFHTLTSGLAGPGEPRARGLGSVSTSFRSLQTATSLPFLNRCNIT